MAQFKCKYCGVKDDNDNLITEVKEYTRKKDHKDGKWKQGDKYNVNVRYHQSCHDKNLQEREELDSLVETIKEIHGIEIIPSQFYSFLQDVRNGNEMFGKIGQRKRKQGYSYRVIEETYRHCSDNIIWAMNNRNFKDTLGFLKYTLAIIRNKITEVNEIVKRKEHQKAQQKDKEVDQSYDYSFDSFSYKDKEDEMDISDML